MVKPDDCPICRKLGTHYYADFDDNMELPEETRQLTMAFDIAFDEDIRVCKHCGTAYHFQFVTDNDIFQPTHTGEYNRITAERAKEMIDRENIYHEEQKKRKESERKRYKQKARKKFAQLFESLSEIEKRIFDYVAERRYEECSAVNIEKELSLEPEIVNAGMAHLKQLGIAWRYTTDPTKIKINF